jgi:hypothetical protein
LYACSEQRVQLGARFGFHRQTPAPRYGAVFFDVFFNQQRLVKLKAAVLPIAAEVKHRETSAAFDPLHLCHRRP